MTGNVDFTKAKQWSNKDVVYDDVDLTAARTKPEEIQLAGKRLYVDLVAFDDKYVISTTKQTGEAIICLNEPNGEPIAIRGGMYFDFNQEFDRIFIRNTAQSGRMLRLTSSIETEIKPFSAEVQIVGGTSAVLDTIADVAVNATTTTQILATNAARKEAIISNLAANATVVRVGDSNTGASRGAEIPPGGSAVIEGGEAIFVYNPSAGTINIGVTYTEN